MLFRNEAEHSKDFNRDILKLYDQVIDNTIAQIKNLENVQEPDREKIEERYQLI
jgi:site-specific DNA-adenine methylase